jgi:hypothetical protein
MVFLFPRADLFSARIHFLCTKRKPLNTSLESVPNRSLPVWHIVGEIRTSMWKTGYESGSWQRGENPVIALCLMRPVFHDPAVGQLVSVPFEESQTIGSRG